MTYQAGLLCVDKPYQVGQYIANQHVGDLIRIGDKTFSTSVYEVNDDRIVYLLSDVSAPENVFYSKLPYSIVDCYFPVQDAIDLGWLAVLVLLIAFTFKMYARSVTNLSGDQS